MARDTFTEALYAYSAAFPGADLPTLMGLSSEDLDTVAKAAAAAVEAGTPLSRRGWATALGTKPAGLKPPKGTVV